ncbi:MAG: PIN domain-containing protein [Verrucomicrobiae bacterium]|nr:PIN domain-containing protein [Verrucomicrobiae bacterium]MCP5541421.1 PIN domain-containing protein [Akkermansiaceae bacterium]
MTVVVDTDVVLDALLARTPFEIDAAKLFAASETGKIEGFLCATAITNVHYIARKAVGTKQASRLIGELLAIFQIASVTHSILKSAQALGFADFEDAVLHESAAAINAQAIVTRNVSDFSKATIPVYEPSQLVSFLGL